MKQKYITEFTSDELRAELKRRSYVLKLHNRRLIKPEDRYHYITATVTEVQRQNPFYRNVYKLQSEEFQNVFNNPSVGEMMSWNVVSGHFTQSTMPRQGDIVKLRYRKSSNAPSMAKIFEVVQRRETIYQKE